MTIHNSHSCQHQITDYLAGDRNTIENGNGKCVKATTTRLKTSIVCYERHELLYYTIHVFP